MARKPYFERMTIQQANTKKSDDRAEKHRKPAKYTVGVHVCYYKGSVCYPSIVQEDLGVSSSAGRKYRITALRPEETGEWDLSVVERQLVEGE